MPENLPLWSRLERAYRGKRTLVTGHTGFKGSWLAEWLLELGADVFGFALPPDTSPALFEQLRLGERVHGVGGDVRDFGALQEALQSSAPDYVFHLAAQPLVRRSYREPRETFETNVMGTVNLLEAVRLQGRPCTVVVVTSDKCYEEASPPRPHTEDDPLGGRDPYSASKGAAEIVASSYRRSFFTSGEPIHVTSARSGNVIGGGDWSEDRIVPDCVRSLSRGVAIRVRNPSATRPWQHVLEPLAGYLQLGATLSEGIPAILGGAAGGAFNFGPDPEACHTVQDVVDEVVRLWPGGGAVELSPGGPAETPLLSLLPGKASEVLGWRPKWDFGDAVEQTVAWYLGARSASSDEIRALTLQQIRSYCSGDIGRG